MSDRFYREKPKSASERFKKFRWIEWNDTINRLELEGTFTAQDLRNLADWIDNPEHPCIAGLPVIKVDLSPLIPNIKV